MNYLQKADAYVESTRYLLGLESSVLIVPMCNNIKLGMHLLLKHLTSLKGFKTNGKDRIDRLLLEIIDNRIIDFVPLATNDILTLNKMGTWGEDIKGIDAIGTTKQTVSDALHIYDRLRRIADRDEFKITTTNIFKRDTQ